MKCITWVGSQDMYWFCLYFLFVFFPCWLVGFRIFIWRKTEKNITMALFTEILPPEFERICEKTMAAWPYDLALTNPIEKVRGHVL